VSFSPPNAPPISAPDVPMLTLAMPQSEPAAGEELLGLHHVAREDRRAEALRHAVVDRDRLVDVGHLDDVEDGRERLLLHDGHVGASLDDRRLDEVPGPLELLAAGEDHAALGLRALERLLVVADRVLVDQGSHQRRRIGRVADAHRRPDLLEAIDHFARHALLHHEPRGRRAALPGRAAGGERDRAHREVEVGVVHHDDRVVAAQFEDRAPMRGPTTSAMRRPMRVEPVAEMSGMRRSLSMRSPTSSTEPITIPNSPGQSNCFIRSWQMFCTAIAVKRHLVRRLPHHRVAADDRERGVPRPHGDREVERRDHAAHAERLPLLVHAVARALAVHREAVQLARQADREVADVDHLLHFAEALGEDLAVLERDQQPRSSFFARSASPSARTSSPRRGAGTVRQVSNARVAAATTIS
jgi:hypothetical protein